MNGHEPKKIKQEKDLDTINSNTLKVSDQRTPASRKANMISGLISRNIDHKSPEVMKRSYTAFTRPHLQYAVQLRSLSYVQHQNLLGRVQRRTTKLIPVLRNLACDKRSK